jgi:serine/threonine protein kinase
MSSRRIGNYQIGDYLGGGGFGSVFKAEDTSSPGRIVAIKELHKKHTRSAVIKQRFFQEAVAMARLDHPNMPRLYTFGEDNGSYYLVMEFLSGKLLTDEISEKQQLPLSQALTIICQVLDAVSYAHRNGIIHRDLKPDNIMLTGDPMTPKVKVLDFGIARMVGGENLTMAGEGFGTPAYMSPERIAGGTDPDSRSDIYSIGIILYEMLTGKPPFGSSATDPVVYWSQMRELHESHELPLEGLGIPADIENIIKKATAKVADYRYATADEMLAALLPAAGQNGVATALPSGNSAQLFLTTVPPAAEVYVDEKLYGASDATNGKMFLDALTPGLHSVRVSKTGYSEYNINVVLEDAKRTELQVPLAARATIVMPQSTDPTAPMDAITVKMQSGDEVATALLMLEGMPVGSQVFVGSKALALAGDDGRATIKLEPGVHELQVTTPSGKIGKRVVTLTQQDTGSLTTMAMPFASGDSQPNLAGATSVIGSPQNTGSSNAAGVTTHVSQQKSESDALQTKRRIAMAAAIVMLLALVASAYFALRKPNTDTSQEVAASQVPPPAATPPANGKTGQTVPATDNATTTAEREAIEREREKLEREKKALEKKEQEIAEKGTEKELPKKETTVPDTTPPPPVEPPTPDSGDGEKGCVGVRVIGPEGQPLQGARVMFTGSLGIETRRTGPNGQCQVCGFTVGSKVKIMALGMGIPVNRELTVGPGRNGIEIRLEGPIRVRPNRPDSPDPEDGEYNPARPRRGNKQFRKRPNM